MSGPNPDVRLSSLFIGEYGKDRRLVRDLFAEFGWHLFESGNRGEALEILGQNPIQAVVADAEVPGWPWKRVLADLRSLSRVPLLVVASRIADDQLWAEALNWGVFDVLARPFRREEVERVVASALRRFPVASEPGRRYAAAAGSHLF